MAKSLNRLVRDLFMELTPIQVFPVHRIIEHILTHGALQAFPRKHAMDSFCNHNQSIKLNMTSLIGVPEPLIKPARFRMVFIPTSAIG